MLRLLRMRDFRLLWTAGLVSMAGDWMLITALPFELYRRTGSPLATAGVLIAGLGPAVLFGSAAGVFVDRWDRRRLMVWVNIALAIALLPLFLIDITGLWIVYAVLVASNVLEQLFVPAEVALLPQLVGPEHLVSANSMSSLNRNLARLVGPALGGLAFAVGGLSFVVVGDLATYLVPAILIALIAPGRSFRAAREQLEHVDDVPSNAPATGVAKLVSEWRDGITHSISHPMLRAILVFALLTGFGEGILGALFVPWTTDVLHGDDAVFAALLSAQAIGGIVGAFAIARAFNRFSAGLLFGMGAIVFSFFGWAIFAYPLFIASIVPALILMVIVGVPATAIGVGYTTLQQTLTVDSHRGRVIGIVGTLMSLGTVCGALVGGVFGPIVGIVPMIAIDYALYFASGVIALRAARVRVETVPIGRAQVDTA